LGSVAHDFWISGSPPAVARRAGSADVRCGVVASRRDRDDVIDRGIVRVQLQAAKPAPPTISFEDSLTGVAVRLSRSKTLGTTSFRVQEDVIGVSAVVAVAPV
jgi:hypothetical protein